MNETFPRKVEPVMPEAVIPATPASPASASLASASHAPIPAPSATLAPSERSSLDQLSRIEDKAARIEEKYARSEALLMRVESAVEKATIRLDEAATHMDLGGLKETAARIERRQKRPTSYLGLVALILISAVASSLLTAWLVRNPAVLSSVIGPR